MSRGQLGIFDIGFDTSPQWRRLSSKAKLRAPISTSGASHLRLRSSRGKDGLAPRLRQPWTPSAWPARVGPFGCRVAHGWFRALARCCVPHSQKARWPEWFHSICRRQASLRQIAVTGRRLALAHWLWPCLAIDFPRSAGGRRCRSGQRAATDSCKRRWAGEPQKVEAKNMGELALRRTCTECELLVVLLQALVGSNPGGGWALPCRGRRFEDRAARKSPWPLGPHACASLSSSSQRWPPRGLGSRGRRRAAPPRRRSAAASPRLRAAARRWKAQGVCGGCTLSFARVQRRRRLRQVGRCSLANADAWHRTEMVCSRSSLMGFGPNIGKHRPDAYVRTPGTLGRNEHHFGTGSTGVRPTPGGV